MLTDTSHFALKPEHTQYLRQHRQHKLATRYTKQNFLPKNILTPMLLSIKNHLTV